MKKRRRTKNHLQFIYASVILFLSAAVLLPDMAEGIEEGLAALVGTLKPILPDFEAVYAAVIRNKVYSEHTREEVEKYYRSVE